MFDRIVLALVWGMGRKRVADEACSATTIRRRRDEWIKDGAGACLARTVLAVYDRNVGLELELSAHGCVTKSPSSGKCAVLLGHIGERLAALLPQAGIPAHPAHAVRHQRGKRGAGGAGRGYHQPPLGRLHGTVAVHERGHPYARVLCGGEHLVLGDELPAERRGVRQRPGAIDHHDRLGQHQQPGGHDDVAVAVQGAQVGRLEGGGRGHHRGVRGRANDEDLRLPPQLLDLPHLPRGSLSR
ncbi:hypothetical protein [Streptomyces alanosinicus]|uniref:hypothetical protein n=1 Tax=Streptomyces alanosinicus TaxID=68171 RepID=UPI001677153A